MTPVEWAAFISAVSVIVASSGSALLTYQITKRSIANDNDQRKQDREDNLMREYNLKLYENRVRVGVTYLEYLHGRNTEAVHCLSLASSGRGTEIVPNALGGLLSDAPIAGVLIFMPPHIRDAALITEGNLRELSQALTQATSPPSPEHLKLFELSFATFAASQKVVRDALSELFQHPANP